MIAYYNGTYLKKENINISPDDRGFLFSDGLYEVVRYYNGKPFRMEEHRQRMENGARLLRFARTRFPEFAGIATELQLRNGLTGAESTIVYIQVTRGSAPRSHAFPSPETPLTVYAFTRPFESHVSEQQQGASAITLPDDRWAHCDIKTTALLPNTLAHQTARDKGAIEAFFIRGDHIREGTHSNVCICSGGTVKTPPLDRFILPGITRKAVLELCKRLSVPFIETPISGEDLFTAEEVFIVGTTVEITPIIQIDDTTVGSGSPGPIAARLLKAYRDLVQA